MHKFRHGTRATNAVHPASKEQSNMTPATSVSGNVHVLTPTKNLVGGDETESLKAAVAKLAAGGVPKVVVDLGKISWVSSRGIAGLIWARKYCVDQGGWFRLAGVGQTTESLPPGSPLFRFEVFKTVEDALKAPVEGSVRA